MARTASPVTSPATLTAVDADGDDFALTFGPESLPAGKAHTDTRAADPVEAALATETVANHYRHEAYREKGKLP
jgi:hypothetical protein